MREKQFAIMVARIFWVIGLAWAVAGLIFAVFGGEQARADAGTPSENLPGACTVLMAVAGVMGLGACWVRRHFFVTRKFVSLSSMSGGIFFFGLTGFACCMALIALAAGYFPYKAGGSAVWLISGAAICLAVLAWSFPKAPEEIPG